MFTEYAVIKESSVTKMTVKPKAQHSSTEQVSFVLLWQSDDVMTLTMANSLCFRKSCPCNIKYLPSVHTANI